MYLPFQVFEGERLIASKNTRLGSFTIDVPKKAVGEIEVPLTMSIDRNGILVAYAEYDGKKEQLRINPDKMSSGDNIQEMLNALETNRKTDRIQAEANRARSQLRTNIEFMKNACKKENNTKTKKLMKKIEEVDKWLSSTKEPLTSEIREKFMRIEDEATKLFITYEKATI